MRPVSVLRLDCRREAQELVMEPEPRLESGSITQVIFQDCNLCSSPEKKTVALYPINIFLLPFTVLEELSFPDVKDPTAVRLATFKGD